MRDVGEGANPRLSRPPQFQPGVSITPEVDKCIRLADEAVTTLIQLGFRDVMLNLPHGGTILISTGSMAPEDAAEVTNGDVIRCLLNEVKANPAANPRVIAAARDMLIRQFAFMKAAISEPVFVLRGQDRLSARLVRKWVRRARKVGVPEERLRVARSVAREMKKFAGRRWPT